MFWTLYYLDVWIITDKRIIDIEQKGIFNREISTFRTDNIQDVTIEIRGIIGTFLKFGDIHIETASENNSFVIREALNPERVKEVILKQHNEIMDRPASVSVVSKSSL